MVITHERLASLINRMAGYSHIRAEHILRYEGGQDGIVAVHVRDPLYRYLTEDQYTVLLVDLNDNPLLQATRDLREAVQGGEPVTNELLGKALVAIISDMTGKWED